MNLWALVLIAVMSLLGTAHASDFDGGGRVGDYLDATATRRRQEIAGVCASACTLKLAAPNACVHADTRLLFHAAIDADGRFDRLATLMMLQEYPRSVREWAKRRGALASLSFTAMSGLEAIALGVRNCDASFAR